MLKWALRIGGGLIVILGILFWWLLLSSSTAPKSAPGVFDIQDWRSKAAASAEALPTEIRIIEVGSDMVPPFAAHAGRFGADVANTYNAIEIVYPDRTIVVGGSIDRLTAEEMVVSEPDWVFNEAAYNRLTDAMLSAEQVLMTHEHLDHVMAIARHPEPAALAQNLVLNAPQIDMLPAFAPEGLDPALANIEPRLSGETESIAPGVVVVPAPGHTPGSVCVFISLQNGEEILLIGDIVWHMGALQSLKTRPVLTQYLIFRPNYEDREAVKRQVRALHDIMVANPALTILPAHDRGWTIAAAEKDGITFLPAS